MNYISDNKKLIISLFIICIFVSQLTVVQASYSWGLDRKKYNFTLTSNWKQINAKTGEETTHKDTTEYNVWNVSVNENIVAFRTDHWELFLGFIHCESPECYDEYLELFKWDNETTSVYVRLFFNETEKSFGYLEPNETMKFLGDINETFPINPLNRNLKHFGVLGLIFLPVRDSQFSFENDFSIYEQAYNNFEIKRKDTFRFQGNRYSGYYFEYSYTNLEGKEDEYKYEEYEEVAYSEKGVLYKAKGWDKTYHKIEGKYELRSELETVLEIDEVDEELRVGFSIYPTLFCLGVLTVLLLYNRRTAK